MTFRELIEGFSSPTRMNLKFKKTSGGVYEIYKDSDMVGYITKYDTGYDVSLTYGDFKDEKDHIRKLSDAKAYAIEVLPFSKTDSKYRVYHSTYTRAIQEVEKYADKLGFKFDEDGMEGEQLADVVGMGPRKPRDGETNSLSFDIYKRNKKQKKALQVQIYNTGSEYELNMYIL